MEKFKALGNRREHRCGLLPDERVEPRHLIPREMTGIPAGSNHVSQTLPRRTAPKFQKSPDAGVAVFQGQQVEDDEVALIDRPIPPGRDDVGISRIRPRGFAPFLGDLVVGRAPEGIQQTYALRDQAISEAIDDPLAPLDVFSIPIPNRSSEIDREHDAHTTDRVPARQ